MASVVMEVDTSQKTGKVTVDGKEVGGLREIYYSTDSSGMGFNLEIIMREEAGKDLKKITRLVAKEDGRVAEAVVSDDISTFIKKRWL